MQHFFALMITTLRKATWTWLRLKTKHQGWDMFETRPCQDLRTGALGNTPVKEACFLHHNIRDNSALSVFKCNSMQLYNKSLRYHNGLFILFRMHFNVVLRHSQLCVSNTAYNVCNGSTPLPPPGYSCQWARDSEGEREVKTVIGGLSRSMVVEGSRDEALAFVMMPVRWEGIWLQTPSLA